MTYTIRKNKPIVANDVVKCLHMERPSNKGAWYYVLRQKGECLDIKGESIKANRVNGVRHKHLRRAPQSVVMPAAKSRGARQNTRVFFVRYSFQKY